MAGLLVYRPSLVIPFLFDTLVGAGLQHGTSSRQLKEVVLQVSRR